MIIAVNDWGETTERISQFAKDQKLEHLILVGGAAFSTEKYGVTSSPTGFWIDHHGKVVRRESGFNPAGLPEMERRIERLLALRSVAD